MGIWQKKVLKSHQFGEIMLLSPSLDEMIDKHHPVRIVSQVIDQVDFTSLERKYKGGSTSSYHPRAILKKLPSRKISITMLSRIIFIVRWGKK